MIRFRMLLLSTFVLGIPSSVDAQGYNDSLAFTHVNVIDCTGSPARTDMTVIIKGDRITSLGKSGNVKIPSDAIILDATNRFMIPGLWDMHVHPRHWDSALFLASGVTGGRSMHGFPEFLELRKRTGQMGEGYDGTQLRSNGSGSGIQLECPIALPILRSRVAGPLMDRSPAAYPGSIEFVDVTDAERVVREVKDSGYDSLNFHIGLPRSSYFALVAEAKRQEFPFVGHVTRGVSAVEASDLGQSSIELMTGIYEACSSVNENTPSSRASVLRETYDQEKAEALFARFARNGTWHVPTLNYLRSRAYSDRTAFTHAQRLRILPRDTVSLWQAAAQRWYIGGATVMENRRRNFSQDLRVIGQMHRAGVKIMAGTDCPNQFCVQGSGLHDELSLFVKAGMTPLEALRSATYRPAEFHGMLNDLGSVEEGKLADLVILNSNPLENIENIRTIESVVFGGRLFNRDELDDMLAVRLLEHSILELAESFSKDKLNSILKSPLLGRVIRLRIQDAQAMRTRIRVNRHVNLASGQDVSLLFTHMPNLRDVYLSNTDMTDLGLSRLAQSKRLKILEADTTRITDKGMAYVCQMPQLQELSLSDTLITDQGLKQLKGLSQLRRLNLAGTKITSKALANIRFFDLLEKLTVDRTSVTDQGLSHLILLQHLTTLSLAGTDITDRALNHIKQLKSLKSLDLTNTTVSLNGVEQFRQAVPQCEVSISPPQLTVKLVHPAPNDFFENGTPLLLKAKTRATTGAVVSRVEFLVDGAIIAEKKESPFEFLWKNVPKGRYEVSVRVIDEARQEDVASQSTPVYVGIQGIESRITSSTDDVEEAEDGSMHAGRNNLHFARNRERGFQVIGLRFTDITIPQGAKITRAYAQFTAHGPGKATTKLVIRAQRSPNAPAFRQEKKNVSSRPTTNSSIEWSPAPWLQKSERSKNQRTADLTRIIQEVISEDEWKSGNALALVISGRGFRNAVAFDGDPKSSARLYVEFEP